MGTGGGFLAPSGGGLLAPGGGLLERDGDGGFYDAISYIDDGGGFLFKEPPAGGGDAGGFPYDFTTTAGIAESAVVVTRTGATIYPQLTAATVLPGGVGNDLVIFEDRGGAEGGGLWCFDSFTNAIATPFDFTVGGGGWTADASTVIVDSVAVAPDGTTTADSITDGSTTLQARLHRTGASVQMSSLWVRDDATVPPTGVGQLTDRSTAGTGTIVTLGTGNTWRRIKMRVPVNATHFAIYAAGDGTAGAGRVPVGAINAWGAQNTTAVNDDSRHYYPLANGGSATGMCSIAVPAADLASIVGADGKIDFEVRFLPSATTEGYATPAMVFYAFRFDTPDGEFSLRCSTRNWILKICGTDRITTSTTSNPVTAIQWREDDEVVLRGYADATSCRLRVRTMACVAPDAKATGLSLTLSTPTAGWLGSNGTTAGSSLKGRITGARNYTDHSSMANATGEAAHVVLLGDSTMSNTSNYIPVGVAIATMAEARAGKRLVNLAVSGHLIASQRTTFLATQYCTDTSVAAVIIQAGVNDANGGRTPAQMTTDAQALILSIQTGCPSAKIIWNAPLAADTATGMTAGDQQVWIDFLSCLGGVAAGGGAAITGLDALETSAMLALHTNGVVGVAGTNTLLAQYTTDNLHEDNPGREIIAAADRAQLIALGAW